MNILKFIKTLLVSACVAVTVCLTSCSDFTDLDQKGMNVLKSTADLDLLLNYQYNFNCDDMMIVSGDVVPGVQLNNLMLQPIKTLTQILVTWDEEGHDEFLADFTSSDSWYNSCYGAIGKIANPILANVDDSYGTDDAKAKVKGEAYLLRAYFHYLAVQKFAKVYNPATASTEMALPYITEEMDVKTPRAPLTMKDYFESIIADIDRAMETEGLPVANNNRMRMNLSAAFAVKALVLMSIKDYEGAEKAAKEALRINDKVVDYNYMTTTTFGFILGMPHDILLRPVLDCEEDYFTVFSNESQKGITPFNESMFEQGHVVHDLFSTDYVMFDNLMGLGYLGDDYPWPATFDLDSSWNNVGLKTTQMYLILAETAINADRIDDAMEALDKIRVNRIPASIYQPLKGSVKNKIDAIFHLKQTSHGENVYTAYNFINRKRWTVCDDYKETFHRTFGEYEMTLSPESTLWVFPIPINVLSMNPYIKQNY